jgi:5-methylcytosine-specific restriction endonuclease McrA
MTVKLCPDCKTSKPLEAFSKNRSRSDGVQGICRACSYARTKAFRSSNGDVYGKRWYDANYKAWYSKNREKVRKRQQDWFDRKRDHVRRLWVIYGAERRAKVGNRPRIKGKQLLGVLEKQKWKCAYCGASLRKSRHIDHIVPLSRGGGTELSNLQGLCPPCNLRKSAKDPIQFLQEIGLLL